MRIVRKYAAPILVAVYFLGLTWRSLFTYFSPDDLMNIYQSWWYQGASLLRANVLFFRTSFWPRPMASAMLAGIYKVAGFHPAPFKAANLVVLVANIFLTYAVARWLTKSRTAAALVTLFAAYHGKSVELYFDTAYVFDVLCYFFYFAAAGVYLRARDRGRVANWAELIAIAGLYVCALDSKELAVTLPLFFLTYELMFHGRPGALFAKRWWAVWLTGIITIAFIAGRILPGQLIQGSPYKPVFTLARYLATTNALVAEIFVRDAPIAGWVAIAVLGGMLGVAWKSRSVALGFAWVFIMFSPLPIAFINPRGLSQHYIPYFGWALYTGVLLKLALDRCRPGASLRTRIYAGGGLFAGLAIVLFITWGLYRPDEPSTVFAEAEENRSSVRQLHKLMPALSPEAQVMFLDDPIPADWYNLTFLTRLSYRNRTLIVMRAKPGASEWKDPPERPRPAGLAGYDHVIDYRGGHFREVKAPWQRDRPPAIVIEDGQPRIFHEDWTLVTRRHPAHPGEQLIVRAIDLGETRPPLAPGQVFPEEPLSVLVAPLSVRIYEILQVAVDLKTGWPGTSDLYRLDVRLPENAPRGLLWITLTSNEVTGPQVEIPVK